MKGCGGNKELANFPLTDAGKKKKTKQTVSRES